MFEKYNEHLKLIYNIYSKIGYNKISFYSKEVIHIDEFKQFLINFKILGFVISEEKIIWIFNNISMASQDLRNNLMYLDFDDFKLSICYLSIFFKIGNQRKKYKKKLLENIKNDIIKAKAEDIENFMNLLELKIPFNRLEIENFINERRRITMKELLNEQNSFIKENTKKKKKKNSSKNKNISKSNDSNNKSLDGEINSGDSSDNNLDKKNNSYDNNINKEIKKIQNININNTNNKDIENNRYMNENQSLINKNKKECFKNEEEDGSDQKDDEEEKERGAGDEDEEED